MNSDNLVTQEMQPSDKTRLIIYRLSLLLSHFSLIYVINTSNGIAFAALVVLSFLSVLVKREPVNKQDITVLKMICIILGLLLITFHGCLGHSRSHLVIALFMCIPASLTGIDLCKIMAKLLSSYTNKDHPCSVEDNHISLKELIIIVITAIISMTMMSGSSPLYPTNPWDDTNVYFTLGRSVLNGLVPYRDVYEQKGPVWHFIQAFCALISDDSFLGVYIVEIIMCSVFLLFSWKITKLFINIKRNEYSVLLIMILAGIVYSSNMFHLGGSCEEFCFPLLTIVLYIGLKSLKQDNRIPSMKEALIVGIITGIIFWIKYTLCSLAFAFVIFFVVYSLIIKKVVCLIKRAGAFLSGFIMVSIPVAIYFIMNNAVKDLIDAYFIDNIFVHSGFSDTDNNLIQFIYHEIKLLSLSFAWAYQNNEGILILLILSVIFFSLFKKRITVFLLTTFCITYLVCYLKDGIIIFYYGFCLIAFTSLMMIHFAMIYENLINKIKVTKLSKYIITIVITTVCFASLILTSKNICLIGVPYETTPQFIFAQEIQKTENPKVMTYDVMDSGFLTASGSLPSNKYYCYFIVLNSLPDVRAEREQLIDGGYFDYIVSRSDNNEWEQYEVIQSADFVFPYANGRMLVERYYLYKRSDLI